MTEEQEVHTCPRCRSTWWVSVSVDGGWTRRAQCVPCGAVHAKLGPGWRNIRRSDDTKED
jgi:transcription elongation factor Elf1